MFLHILGTRLAERVHGFAAPLFELAPLHSLATGTAISPWDLGRSVLILGLGYPLLLCLVGSFFLGRREVGISEGT